MNRKINGLKKITEDFLITDTLRKKAVEEPTIDELSKEFKETIYWVCENENIQYKNNENHPSFVPARGFYARGLKKMYESASPMENEKFAILQSLGIGGFDLLYFEHVMIPKMLVDIHDQFFIGKHQYAHVLDPTAIISPLPQGIGRLQDGQYSYYSLMERFEKLTGTHREINIEKIAREVEKQFPGPRNYNNHDPKYSTWVKEYDEKMKVFSPIFDVLNR